VKPLENKIVYVSRSREQSPDEIRSLEENGARVIAFPTIRIDSIEDTSFIDEAIKNITKYNYVIFTSTNAVKFFSKRIKSLGKSIPDSLHVISVGEKTQKACNRNEIKVDSIPDQYSAKGVLQMLSSIGVSDSKILIPSSIISRDELAIGLKQLGAEVELIPIYSNSSIDDQEYFNERAEIINSKPDAFVFTSPSSFISYLKAAKIEEAVEYFSNHVVAAIGNTTKREIEKLNINVDVVPDKNTLEDTIKELIKFYSSEVGV